VSAGRWSGKTVICIGSGPSLTQTDCELAKASGHAIVAVNSSWQMVPYCAVIYASDYDWWKKNHQKITIGAERWTNNRKAEVDYRCNRIPGLSGYNSGLAAILLANHFGAERILLLGYDCQATNGQAHWHPPHKGNNPNEISYRIWAKQFRSTGRAIRDKVVNCSRHTAITVFQRSSLSDALLDGTEDKWAKSTIPHLVSAPEHA